MPWGWLFRVGAVLTPLAIGGGALYAILIWAFSEALKSSAALEDLHSGLDFGWYGPETLLAGHSMLLGWVTVAAIQSRLGMSGPILLLIALPFWGLAIGTGFLVGAALTEDVPDILELLAGCVVLTAVAGAARVWLPD